jgi:hypothetical protein
MALSAQQRQFLIAVRDDESVFPIIFETGYVWALQNGLIRQVRPEPALDFKITAKGRTALSNPGKGP